MTRVALSLSAKDIVAHPTDAELLQAERSSDEELIDQDAVDAPFRSNQHNQHRNPNEITVLMFWQLLGWDDLVLQIVK